MAKYTRIEEKPLSEVIGIRKRFYQARIAKAFDTVYNSENFEYIEQFEQAVLVLSTRAIQRNLEGLLVLDTTKAKAIEKNLKK